MKKSFPVNKFYEDVHNVSTTVVSSKNGEKIFGGGLKGFDYSTFYF